MTAKTGRSAKAKGAAAENSVAALLREAGFPDAHRGKVFYHEADIEGGIPGIHIEVKRQETIRLRDWMKQSTEAAAKTGEIPVVVHRRNREDWMITMRFQDFLTYITKGDKE